MSDTTIVEGITPEQQETIEKIYRAVGGEFDLLNEAVTDDWQDIPPAPGQGRGPDAAKPIFEHFHSIFKDVSITILEIIGANGHVAVRAEMKGVHAGEFFGVPATNKECAIRINEFHHFEGDKVAASWHMEDWLGWMRQVGADTLHLPS
jgi:predicted ester cyclase